MKTIILFLSTFTCLGIHAQDQDELPKRARELGIPFEGKTGKYNNITDVPGVEVRI